MNKEIKLYNAITNIDDSIISEAETFVCRKKKAVYYLFPAAACFAAVLAVAVIKGPKIPLKTVIPEDSFMQPETVSQSQEISETGAEGKIDNINWQTPEEILIGENGNVNGLFVPTFVAYKGGFYGSLSEADVQRTDIRYAADLSGENILFNKIFGYSPYLVENRPDCIALLINGYFTIYQRQFDVIFEYEGKTYGIAYPSEHPDSCTLGDVLLENDDFTLYSAVFYKGEEYEETQMIVDILPMLRSKGFEFFKEDCDENGEPIHYMDAWWVVKPIIE